MGNHSTSRLFVGVTPQGLRRFLAAILSTVGLALTNMLTPQIVRVTVDSVLGSEPFDLPPFLADLLNRLGGAEVLREKLWMIGIVIVGIAVFGFAFFYGSRVFNTKAAEPLGKTMRWLCGRGASGRVRGGGLSGRRGSVRTP